LSFVAITRLFELLSSFSPDTLESLVINTDKLDYNYLQIPTFVAVERVNGKIKLLPEQGEIETDIYYLDEDDKYKSMRNPVLDRLAYVDIWLIDRRNKYLVQVVEEFGADAGNQSSCNYECNCPYGHYCSFLQIVTLDKNKKCWIKEINWNEFLFEEETTGFL